MTMLLLLDTETLDDTIVHACAQGPQSLMDLCYAVYGIEFKVGDKVPEDLLPSINQIRVRLKSLLLLYLNKSQDGMYSARG